MKDSKDKSKDLKEEEVWATNLFDSSQYEERLDDNNNLIVLKEDA